jgi:hypothetical protein
VIKRRMCYNMPILH